MNLPDPVRVEYVSLYQQPRAIVDGILRKGQLPLFNKLWPIFRDYRIFGFTAIDYLTEFASKLLSLGADEYGLGKDVGFALYDIALREGKFLKVGSSCLDVVNRLSSLLVDHTHTLLIVHMMQQVIQYFDGQIRGQVHGNEGEELVSRFNDYYIFVPRNDFQQASPQLQARLTRTHSTESKGEDDEEDEEPVITGWVEPLIYSLRGIAFCLDDLVHKERAKFLRQRLVETDQLHLAKRVFLECEYGDAVDFDKYVKSRMETLKTDIARFTQALKPK